eukprot:2151240-Alexandrium_andersonii.AAC.1
MAWVAQRRLLADDIWVDENAKDFPWKRVLGCLKGMYVIQSTLLDTAELGWPQRRVRRITIGILKSRVNNIIVPWPQAASRFRRKLELSWTDLMIAEPEELAAELEWGRGRPSSLRRKNFIE